MTDISYDDHPIAAMMPLMSKPELEELAVSMRTHGFDPRHPILLLDGKIVDGRNRYRAAKLADVAPLFDTVKDVDPWDLVWRENAARRHLEKGQKAALFVKFTVGSEEWQRAEAKHKAKRARAAVQNDADSDDSTSPRSRERDRIAAAAGVSPATAARAKELQRRSPEDFERVVRGEVPLNRALAAAKKAAVIEQIEAKPAPLPTGQHHVIAIDPPWPYDTRAENRDVRGTVDYPDMSIEEICALPVATLAEDDCILWLWTTNAFMRPAFTCLDAWGFAEKTILTWDKEKIGTGHWLRNVTEHCIIAVRGRPLVKLSNQSTILRAPRREHSRKPDEFYELVEKLCPGSKLEMFARQARPGWNAWGAELGKFDA